MKDASRAETPAAGELVLKNRAGEHLPHWRSILSGREHHRDLAQLTRQTHHWRPLSPTRYGLGEGLLISGESRFPPFGSPAQEAPSLSAQVSLSEVDDTSDAY